MSFRPGIYIVSFLDVNGRTGWVARNCGNPGRLERSVEKLHRAGCRVLGAEWRRNRTPRRGNL